MAPPWLEARSLSKSYLQGKQVTDVISDISFSLDSGQIMSLMGPSGSGKSTLMNILGLLDRPSGGEFLFEGELVNSWNDRQREKFRADKLGFVFQRHLLLPEFNLIENIVMPQALKKGWSGELLDQAHALLDKMSLRDRSQHLPSELSGGEVQRGAIARAILHKPSMLLMDEPTGNLDPDLGFKIMTDIMGMIKEEGLACILVTHNPKLADLADRQFELSGHSLHEKS